MLKSLRCVGVLIQLPCQTQMILEQQKNQAKLNWAVTQLKANLVYLTIATLKTLTLNTLSLAV